MPPGGVCSLGGIVLAPDRQLTGQWIRHVSDGDVCSVLNTSRLLRAGITLVPQFVEDDCRKLRGVHDTRLPRLEDASRHELRDRIRAVFQAESREDSFVGRGELTNLFRPERKILQKTVDRHMPSEAERRFNSGAQSASARSEE